MAAKHQRTFEDFEPRVESSEEDGCSILTLYIPGFSKEQIRVQVSSTRKLRISGERPYRNKAWQRFHKEFQIPSNCNTANITAKYKSGILHVRQPLQDESKPPQPQPQPPEQQSAKQQQANQDPADEKKSSPAVAANGRVLEAKSTKETEGSTFSNANKITSWLQRPGVLAKLILPILLAVLLFLFAKRLSLQNMFVGVGDPPQ